MVQSSSTKNGFKVKGGNYTLSYDRKNRLYVDLLFSNGIGSSLFIPSSCDQEGQVDLCVRLSAPSLRKTGDGNVLVTFTGESSVWKGKTYVFECRRDTVIYRYTVEGTGNLENVWFFHGYLKDDPALSRYGYPYFAGLGRNKAYHRPLNEFSHGMKPKYDLYFAPTLNSADTRYFMYYQSMTLRVDGSRTFLGGDWLATPPPFCYLMGTREKQQWVSFGLAAKPGQNNFFGFYYFGGEEAGFNLDFRGQSRVRGTWESPAIVFQASADEYAGLKQYVQFLQDDGYMARPDRDVADWWYRPIFCCWGEQMYLSDKWERYLLGDQKIDIGSISSRKFFDGLLRTLDRHGINPGTLIVDNRWARRDEEFLPDPKSWGDLRDFVDVQHKKDRKVILWAAPFSHAQNALGKRIPVDECILADQKIDTSIAWYNVDIYNPEDVKADLDTDVFYPYEHKGIHPTPPRKGKPVPIFVDPTNPKYEKRLREKIRFNLSPKGLNADGYKFDYTHYIPTARGAIRHGTAWGIEMLRKLLWIYHDEAKQVKKDAMIIAHTYNPYFSDVVDMCRVQDLYTDQKSIVEAAMHRAAIGRIACPGCLIDSDNHPVVSLAAWEEYAKAQPRVGVPALYYISGIEVTRERLMPKHFQMIKRVWAAYERGLK